MPATPASVDTAAAKASAFDHSGKARASRASSKAARAYGRARVRVSDMSDPGDQLVDQRLVRGRVDFALHDLARTGQGQRADLVAQFVAGLLGHVRDVVLGDLLLSVDLFGRLGTGLLDDLVALLLRAVDDFR